ncbi:MAG: epoxyqueuosine reductase QueH [bacterium]|nr:epoxyqueuosine reductase QueH [bacterium]
MNRVLLHVCCGPCAIGPLATLRAEGLTVTGFFANANLYPPAEHGRRLAAARRLAEAEGLELGVERPDATGYARAVSGDPPDRCLACYRFRLDRVAAETARRDLDGFTTSLLASPHQGHELVAAAALETARRHGVAFLYRDFRPGWAGSVARSKELGLYRQRYCGCHWSLADREE